MSEKLARLIYCETAVEKFRHLDIPADYAQDLNKFLKEVNPQYKKFQEESNKLAVEKYGITNKNSKDIAKETIEAYQGEVRLMLEAPIEAEIPMFSMAKILEFNPHFCISQDTFSKLENFLIFE